MLNSIGLQNPGLAAFAREQWPLLAGLDAQVVVNIAGFAVEEFGQMAARLEALAGIAALEVNISCPNIEAGGDNFATRPQTAAAAIAAVRSRTERPIIAKLTPNVTDIAEIARAAVDAGADAVSLINTLVGMAIDVERRRPVLGGITGGLSGPAIKPVALAMVWKVAQAVDVPVMGIGGIATASDALEFMVAGACGHSSGHGQFCQSQRWRRNRRGASRLLRRARHRPPCLAGGQLAGLDGRSAFSRFLHCIASRAYLVRPSARQSAMRRSRHVRPLGPPDKDCKDSHNALINRRPVQWQRALVVCGVGCRPPLRATYPRP